MFQRFFLPCLSLCLLFSFLHAERTFTFSEYRLSFPDNWKEIPHAHLKGYLGYYHRNSSTNPCWSDPAFVRGWNECKPKSGERRTMCLLYRIKNEQRLNLDSCAKMIEQRYANQDSPIKDFKVATRGDIVLNGTNAKWFDAMMKIQEEKTAIRHYVLLSGEYAYYFYFTTTLKHFSKIQDQLKTIAQSFVIQ